jgi:hypothetical protein
MMLRDKQSGDDASKKLVTATKSLTSFYRLFSVHYYFYRWIFLLWFVLGTILFQIIIFYMDGWH